MRASIVLGGYSKNIREHHCLTSSTLVPDLSETMSTAVNCLRCLPLGDRGDRRPQADNVLDTVARAQRVLGYPQVVDERAVEAAEVSQEPLGAAAMELAVAAAEARASSQSMLSGAADARRVVSRLEDTVLVGQWRA
jgi:hypothetical protein